LKARNSCLKKKAKGDRNYEEHPHGRQHSAFANLSVNHEYNNSLNKTTDMAYA